MGGGLRPTKRTSHRPLLEQISFGACGIENVIVE